MSDGLSRYHRQMLLPRFGEEGQQRLGGSSALIAGCGALGTVIAETLCRAGVGRLVIVDRDYVEWTNLQRQVLFDEADAETGLPKAVAAERKLRAINAQVQIDARVIDLNAGNVEHVAGIGDETSRVDVILDGLDNFETRYLLNDVAVKHGIPYLYGGAVGYTGAALPILPHSAAPDVPMARRATPWERQGLATPDLRDLFAVMPAPGSQPTCDTAGVLGPVVQMVAAFQSAEALKVLLGRYTEVCPTLLSIDLAYNRIRQIDVSGAYAASEGVCSKQRVFEYLDGDRSPSAVTLCGRQAVQILPGRGANEIAVNALKDRLASVSRRVVANEFLVRAEIDDTGEPYELTVFTDGRAIIKGTTRPEVARRVYAKYVGA